MMMDQPPLFDVETPPVKPARASTKSDRPRWGKYRPLNPVRCDDCVTVLVDAKGDGPATRNARWRRRTPSSDLVLCFAHAQIRRTEDGLERLDEAS